MIAVGGERMYKIVLAMLAVSLPLLAARITVAPGQSQSQPNVMCAVDIRRTTSAWWRSRYRDRR